MEAGRSVRHLQFPPFSPPSSWAGSGPSPAGGHPTPTPTPDGGIGRGPGNDHVPQTLFPGGNRQRSVCFKSLDVRSSSASVIWVLKSNRREMSRYAGPRGSPPTLPPETRLSRSRAGGVRDGAVPPPWAPLPPPPLPGRLPPASRPPIVPSQLSLRADPRLPIGKPARHSAHTPPFPALNGLRPSSGSSR